MHGTHPTPPTTYHVLLPICHTRMLLAIQTDQLGAAFKPIDEALGDNTQPLSPLPLPVLLQTFGEHVGYTIPASHFTGHETLVIIGVIEATHHT